MRWGKGASSIGVLLTLLAVLRLPAQEAAGDVKSLLDQGLHDYEEGNMDGAVQAFEKALAMNPSSDAILTFVEKAGHARIVKMVRSKDPQVSGIGRTLLGLSTRARNAKIGDPAQIRAAVDEVLRATGQEQILLKLKHTGTFGRNLVPALIPALADTSIERRAVAITWIKDIGLDAVPVLQAARKHPDPLIRRNVAGLLGLRTLRHAVALGTLKAMVETDPVGEVKDAATKSLGAILSDMNGKAKDLSAKEYFLASAYDLYYLKPYQNPFAGSYYTPTVYRLSGEQVVGERIADFQLSERMAQRALEEALELDPAFLEAQVLTVCNDAAQVAEYDQNVAYYAKNEGQADTKDLLEKQRPYIDGVLRNRILAAPAEVLYEGLMQALDNSRPDVAIKLIETIRTTGRKGKVPDALVKALEDPQSRLVRTHAAIALAHWNPISGFDAGDLVVSNLSEAVVTSGVRTVQRMMTPGQQANRVDQMLRELHMETYTPHDSIERGFNAVISSPPDLVIVDETVKSASERKDRAPINYFVNEIRKNYRTANVPVVVMVPSSRLEEAKRMYESDERKVHVVPDSIDRQAFEKGVVEKLFKESGDSKSMATRLASEAAKALHHLAVVPTRLPAKKSIPSLMLVLKDRPDEVRLPAIMALGELGAREATDELAMVFANAENPKPIRVEAMVAAGKALEGEGGASQAVLEVIDAGMKESDLDLRRAAWFAFSNAGADGKKRLEALLAQAPAGAAPADSASGSREARDDASGSREARDDPPAQTPDAPAEPTEAAEPAQEPAPAEAPPEEPRAEPSDAPPEEPAVEESTEEPAEEK